MTSKKIANLEMVRGVLDRAKKTSIDFNDQELKTLFKATPETIRELRRQEKKKDNEKDDGYFWDSEMSVIIPSETKWIVEKVIPQNSISVISGSAGMFKSWLCLDMAYCISEGIPFLDKFETIKNKVLYVDRENGFNEILLRRKLIRNGHEFNDNQGLFVAYNTEFPFKLEYDEHLENLENFIKKNEIKVVIIDTYRRVTLIEENDANKVSWFFDRLKQLIDRTNISIILIHHHRKGESASNRNELLRGSSDLVNFVDNILQVSARGNFLNIRQTKNRKGKELEPFNASIETDETSYMKIRYAGINESMDRVVSKSLVSWILDCKILKFTYSEGLKYAKEKGFSDSNFKNALALLQHYNFIAKGETKRSPYYVSEKISLEVFDE